MAFVSADSYPRYRLRLFLSVDLAGSTAFKAGDGKKQAEGSTSQPLWVETIRYFYLQFPQLIARFYRPEDREDVADCFPRVWKTVGDEIVFCCRLVDTAHLSLCMNAFLKALGEFGTDLRDRAKAQNVKGLDVKGAAWIAAFPHPNVTVALDASTYTADQFDEDFELQADKEPRGVDFLGNGIDCGFRLAGRSTVDRCPVSLELAFLLAQEAERSAFDGKFSDYEKCVLKGVLNDRPYPVIFLETERSAARRRVRHHERILTGAKSLTPIDVHTFVQHFMADEAIEAPSLPTHGNDAPPLPTSYQNYRETWMRDVNELELRRATEQEGERPENDGGDEIPAEVVGFTTQAEDSASDITDSD